MPLPAAGSRRAKHARGFTLLEVLLALALMALVMLGVWGALASASRTTHAADALMARSENVRTVQQFLRRYVAAAGMMPWTQGDGSRPRVFEGRASSMRYVAPLPAQAGHAGLYLQALSLQQDPAGGMTLRLEYRPYGEGPRAEREPVRHVLLTGLAGGSFQYLAAATSGRPAGWRDDWTSLNGLPLAVRIHLDPAWRVRVGFPDLLIPLPRGEGFGTQLEGAP